MRASTVLALSIVNTAAKAPVYQRLEDFCSSVQNPPTHFRNIWKFPEWEPSSGQPWSSYEEICEKRFRRFRRNLTHQSHQQDLIVIHGEDFFPKWLVKRAVMFSDSELAKISQCFATFGGVHPALWLIVDHQQAAGRSAELWGNEQWVNRWADKVVKVSTTEHDWLDQIEQEVRGLLPPVLAAAI